LSKQLIFDLDETAAPMGGGPSLWPKKHSKCIRQRKWVQNPSQKIAIGSTKPLSFEAPKIVTSSKT
jgi:hypothetical protein